MGQYDVVGSWIQGREAGQRVRRNDRQEAEAVEDRDIEKQLLALRLREIKVQESLRKREAAKEALNLRSGKPMSQVPENWLAPITEADRYMTPGIGVLEQQPDIQRRMAPMTIPGIPEYGLPDEQIAPETMEQMIAQIAANARATQAGKQQVVGRGGVLMENGVPIFRNPYEAAPPNPQQVRIGRPDGTEEIRFELPVAGKSFSSTPYRTPMSVTDRDVEGNETTSLLDPATAPRNTPVAKRAPAPSAGGTAALNQDAIDAQNAIDALTEYDKILNTEGLNTKGTDYSAFRNFFQKDVPPDPAYTSASAAAQQAYAKMLGGTDTDTTTTSDVLQVDSEDMAARKAAVKKAIATAQKRLATAMTRVPTRAGAGGGGGTKTKSRATIGEDGKLYINGVLVGEP